MLIYVNTYSSLFPTLLGVLAPSCVGPLYALICVVLVCPDDRKKIVGLTPHRFLWFVCFSCRQQ